jgi:hypothetical protein
VIGEFHYTTINYPPIPSNHITYLSLRQKMTYHSQKLQYRIILGVI